MLIVMALTMNCQAETVLDPLPMDTITANSAPEIENYVSDSVWMSASL